MASTPDSTLQATIERNPKRAIAAFLLLHAAVWTALPTALYPNLPLDLIEALIYGREWQLGHDKLPPLPWWLVEIAYRTVGHDFAYYLLGQISACVAFLFVFMTARPLVGTAGALIALMIVDGLHYLNFTTAKFNHDVIQLPFWAMAGFAFHKSLRTGKLGAWALLGFAVGMALWAKYFVVMLVIPLVVFVVLDREARRCLATPGPYLAAAVALIVTSPHLVWLAQNDFLPLHYVESRAQLPRGLIDHVWRPLEFALGQWFFMLPSLLIAATLFFPRKRGITPADYGYDRRIVTLLALGPFATMLALTAVTGRMTVAMWGHPLWMFLGLWLVMMMRGTLDAVRVKRAVTAWSIVASGIAVAFVIGYAVLPFYDHRYRAAFFPGEQLGIELTARFRALTGKPLAYIVASMWDGGNVSHYSPEQPQPRVLIDGRPSRAPWIDLADLRSKGAIVVWTDGEPDKLPVTFRGVADGAEIQTQFTLPMRRAGGTIRVNWAVLRPQPAIAGR